jgi:hypothetical protein
MGTTSVRRRGFVRRVLARAEATGDLVAPWRGLDGMDDTFADEADLLVELHREWVRHLVSRLHHGEVVAQRTPANVRDLYDEVGTAHAALHGILQAHATEPALEQPTAQEHALLARIAGLVDDDAEPARAAALGRALVTQRIPIQRHGDS